MRSCRVTAAANSGFTKCRAWRNRLAVGLGSRRHLRRDVPVPSRRRLPAASVIERLRTRTASPIVLLSDRPTEEVAILAETLAVDQYVGGVSTLGTARFLDDCTRRGLRPAWVGDVRWLRGLAHWPMSPSLTPPTWTSNSTPAPPPCSCLRRG